MALTHAKKHTIRTSLGIWWVIIRDVVYIGIMMFFRYLMSGDKQVEGVHFIVYLLLGLIPWFFMNEVINGGVKAFNMNVPIVKGITFPVTILSTIEVTAIFIKRLVTLIFCFIAVIIFEDLSNANYWLLIFYFFNMYFLMVIYNLIFSAFVAVSEDFTQLYSTISRVLLFFLPILWSYERLEGMNTALVLLKIMPFSYIITGFRQAFMGTAPPTKLHSIIYYSEFIIMFLAGCRIQYKFRKHYADFL